MKISNLRSVSFYLGLLVLFTSLTLATTKLSAGTLTGNHSLPYSISKIEIDKLLAFYSIEEDIKIENVKVKIFDKNDELIYSTQVCPSLNECDERLNQFINQSDFITEVDNTKIYILNH